MLPSLWKLMINYHLVIMECNVLFLLTSVSGVFLSLVVLSLFLNPVLFCFVSLSLCFSLNIILYYTILYYTILYYTILYYTILYYTIAL